MEKQWRLEGGSGESKMVHIEESPNKRALWCEWRGMESLRSVSNSKEYGLSCSQWVSLEVKSQHELMCILHKEKQVWIKKND